MGAVPAETSVHQNNHNTHPKYRPDIDGLRAIAVLSVVCFHAFPNWIKGGFIGVDIFFVISGYLISTIIIDSLKRNAFSFTEFYSRRIRRIFPALLIVLTASFVFGWFALLASEYMQLGKHIAGGAGFVSNLVLWEESGYFDYASDTKPLLHLWSLGIEEQFYIAWPLLLWLFWKQGWNLVLVTTSIAIISFALNVANVIVDQVAVFYSPQSRFWELLAGSIMASTALRDQNAQMQSGYKPHPLMLEVGRGRSFEIPCVMNKNVQSVLGATLIVLGLSVITERDYFPGTWAALPTAGAILIITAGPQAWLNQAVLSNRILVWIGLISFPLYLWHWPILVFGRIVEGATPSLQFRIAAVVASIVLAGLTYKLIEKPIRLRKSDKAAFTLFVLMILIGGTGYITYRSEGLGFRNSKLEQVLLQFEWDKTYNSTKECKARYPGPGRQYCIATDINANPTIALIGDSHANHFFPGLSEYFKRKGENLLNVGAGACPPFLEVDRGEHPDYRTLNCYKRTKSIYDYVKNDKNIKTVILVFHHSEYFRNDVQFIDMLSQINYADNYDNSLAALVRTIRTFEKQGKTVAIIYDMPEIGFDIKRCFPLRPFQTSKVSCSIDDILIDEDFVKYQAMMDIVLKATSAKIFYTHEYFKGNFPINMEGVPTYRDSTHLSIAGSMFFADKYSF